LAIPAFARVSAKTSARSEGAQIELIHSENLFLEKLHVEQKRTERSSRPFVLMLVGSNSSDGMERDLLRQVQTVLLASIRETDIIGWYKDRTTIGIIFTEIAAEVGVNKVIEILETRFQTSFADNLEPRDAQDVKLTFHVFPNDRNTGEPENSSEVLRPSLKKQASRSKGYLWAKRAMDILGSLAALIILSPVLAAVAAAVKLSSKGPIFFRQKRVGLHGQHFTFLKFRSMYNANDPAIHREYIEKFIAGRAQKSSDNKGMFKLANDPRITPVGRFLRRTSLDELPQFINVLRGDMSLVGPRPPIPYEVSKYETWHKRRFLMVKPGITGLWQVTGRSKTTFDEMVRLDLRYAKSRSLWLDVKILVQTPLAVIKGDGAC